MAKHKVGIEHLVGAGVLVFLIGSLLIQRASAEPQPGRTGPNTVNVTLNDEQITTLFF